MIYAEEQDYPRLLAFLQQAKGNRLEMLMQYAVHLKEAYPKEMLEFEGHPNGVKYKGRYFEVVCSPKSRVGD